MNIHRPRNPSGDIYKLAPIEISWYILAEISQYLTEVWDMYNLAFPDILSQGYLIVISWCISAEISQYPSGDMYKLAPIVINQVCTPIRVAHPPLPGTIATVRTRIIHCKRTVDKETRKHWISPKNMQITWAQPWAKFHLVDLLLMFFAPAMQLSPLVLHASQVAQLQSSSKWQPACKQA